MGRLRGLTQGLALRDVLFAGGFALFLAFGYLSLESPTMLAPLGDQAALAQSTFLALAVCGRITVYATMAFICLRRPRPAASPLASALFTGGVALVGFLVLHFAFDFATYAPFEKILPWLVIGGFLFGGGSALATLMWARFSGTFDQQGVYLFVLIENLVSLAVYFAATLLPDRAVFPVSALLFFASVVLAKFCLDRRADNEVPAAPATPSAKRAAFSALWRPTLGTAILFFMSALMLQMPHNQDLSLTQFQSTSLLTQGAVIAALLVPVVAVRRQPRLASVFKVALPLSATGFLLLPLIWSGAGGIANACAQLGAGVADIILWCMVAALVNETRLPAALPFSCTLLATNAAKLAGTLVGLAFHDHLTRGGVALTAIALMAVYLVAMMSMFLLRERTGGAASPADAERRGAGDAAGNSPEAQADALHARCAALADEYGLTPREAELLAQLAHGRTLRAISERLVVSENTVKYHVKAIYQKLGVHSRDEVIDLLGPTDAP